MVATIINNAGGSQNKDEDGHTNVFTFYAFDTKLDLLSGVGRNTVLEAIDGYIEGAGAFSAGYLSTNIIFAQ